MAIRIFNRVKVQVSSIFLCGGISVGGGACRTSAMRLPNDKTRVILDGDKLPRAKN